MTVSSQTASSAVLNMLVLDDSDFDRKNLCRLGKKTGLPISIETAQSLSAMSYKMHQAEFDLIFIDYSLPDGNGFEALDLVRSNPNNCESALVMVSGCEKIDLAVQAMQKGYESYLCKSSLTPEILRQTILDATERRKIHAPQPRKNPLTHAIAEGFEIALQRRDLKSRMEKSPGFAKFWTS